MTGARPRLNRAKDQAAEISVRIDVQHRVRIEFTIAWRTQSSRICPVRTHLQSARLPRRRRGGLPLATLDSNLSKPARKAGVKRFDPG